MHLFHIPEMLIWCTGLRRFCTQSGSLNFNFLQNCVRCYKYHVMIILNQPLTGNTFNVSFRVLHQNGFLMNYQQTRQFSNFLFYRKYSIKKHTDNTSKSDDTTRRAFSIAGYAFGSVLLLIGLCYVAVPAYRVFCQATSLGGVVTNHNIDKDKIDAMNVVKDRPIRIIFEADVNSNLAWEFKPLQRDIWVNPGETALAFYSAHNLSPKPVVGVSTYNVIPFQAGKYFSKIQCFCFEEQMLNPGEELDMPVFFYIDPEFITAPEMEHVDQIVLSYTFFESVHGLQLPHPLTPPPRDNPTFLSSLNKDTSNVEQLAVKS